MKITAVVFLSCLLSTAQALLSYYAIYKNSDTSIVTECQYIWWFDVGSGVHGTIQAIYSLYTVLCFLLLSDDKKKRPLLSHLTVMALMIVAGGFIKGRISDSCIEIYQTKYSDVWNCFNITFWYAVTLCSIFALVNVLWCFYRCFCNNTDTVQPKKGKALNDKLVAENQV